MKIKIKLYNLTINNYVDKYIKYIIDINRKLNPNIEFIPIDENYRINNNITYIEIDKTHRT